MTLFKITKKLADFLKGRTIYFDHKSYDFAEDIPHIFDGDKRHNVHRVRFNENGEFFEIITDSYACRVDLCDVSEDDFNEEVNAMGLDELLHDIYYETEESWEIGDFEDDFLTLEENTSTEETEEEEEKTQTYRIAVTNVEYGFIDVVATSLDEAMEKVECFDGDYYVNKNTIANTELIEILDN
jgi:hypothetical protein